MSGRLLEYFNDVERKHWWWEGRRQLLKQLLEGSDPRRILDVGCGTGETLVFLKSVFPKSKLYGIDLNDRAIEFSKKRGLKNITKGRAGKLPFEDNYFDVVLFLDVIEHINKDDLIINEAKRVLNKGGKIIITAPAINLIWSVHDKNQGHKRRYTKRRIKYLASKSGMKIEFLSYFNFFLSLPIIAVRILGKIKILDFLNSYDNSLNYNIAKTILNKPLTKLFKIEVFLLKFVRYPIGISIVAVLKK